MGEGALDLAQQVRGELARPAPDAAVRLSAAIRERLGDATEAVVFYGSCLRKDTDEGVLDFYVVVDDYRRALDSVAQLPRPTRRARASVGSGDPGVGQTGEGRAHNSSARVRA